MSVQSAENVADVLTYARIQRYLGTTTCTSGSERDSSSKSCSGMRDMKLSRCASLEMACH